MEEGERLLAALVRNRLGTMVPDLLELMDPPDNEVFLEPLLFATLNEKEFSYPIAPIVFGYMSVAHRPREIPALSDRDGLVYLPKIGYFITDCRNQELRLSWRESVSDWIMYSGMEKLPYRFENLQTIANGQIEIVPHIHPLWNRLFPEKERTVENRTITIKHLENIRNAFEIIHALHPWLYGNMLRCIRKIVIFHSNQMNSFASMFAHGTAFLNASDCDDEVFFVEDLAHQCGHVLFNAVTLGLDQYFAVDPDTPLKTFTSMDSETRTLYDAFHGVFTEALMIQSLNSCHENNDFKGRQAHELLGRIAFILRRFGTDLHCLIEPGIFTEKGNFLLHNIFQEFKGRVAQHSRIVREFDFSNQPYNFNYDKFVELNRSS